MPEVEYVVLVLPFLDVINIQISHPCPLLEAEAFGTVQILLNRFFSGSGIEIEGFLCADCFERNDLKLV